MILNEFEWFEWFYIITILMQNYLMNLYCFVLGLLRWWNLQIVLLSWNFAWLLATHVEFEKRPLAIFSDPPMPIYEHAPLWPPGL